MVISGYKHNSLYTDSPLIEYSHSQEVAGILDKGGVDVNQRSSDGFAPLCVAAFWGYAEIVKLLLERG